MFLTLFTFGNVSRSLWITFLCSEMTECHVLRDMEFQDRSTSRGWGWIVFTSDQGAACYPVHCTHYPSPAHKHWAHRVHPSRVHFLVTFWLEQPVRHKALWWATSPQLCCSKGLAKADYKLSSFIVFIYWCLRSVFLSFSLPQSGSYEGVPKFGKCLRTPLWRISR